jgi:hypothetical protein
MFPICSATNIRCDQHKLQLSGWTANCLTKHSVCDAAVSELAYEAPLLLAVYGAALAVPAHRSLRPRPVNKRKQTSTDRVHPVKTLRRSSLSTQSTTTGGDDDVW